ncbi:MAG: hypothetical protein RSD90_07460 [Anaerovoracaceae bacterium]
MMSRKFTSREKILLVVLCVMILGIFYYQFVVKETNRMIKEYDVNAIQDELAIEQATALNKMQMKKEMESTPLLDTGTVASYNNIKAEINAMNDIFSKATTYNLDFEQAKVDGTAVRRNIKAVFSCNSYKTVTAIIKDLHDCRYRCLIRNVSIVSTSGQEKGLKTSNDINVSLDVTFYETTYNSDTKAGLLEESSETNESEEQ